MSDQDLDVWRSVWRDDSRLWFFGTFEIIGFHAEAFSVLRCFDYSVSGCIYIYAHICQLLDMTCIVRALYFLKNKLLFVQWGCEATAPVHMTEVIIISSYIIREVMPNYTRRYSHVLLPLQTPFMFSLLSERRSRHHSEKKHCFAKPRSSGDLHSTHQVRLGR